VEDSSEPSKEEETKRFKEYIFKNLQMLDKEFLKQMYQKVKGIF